MAHRVFCLECNAIVGEDRETGDADRGSRLTVCQTCTQHQPPATPARLGQPALAFWRWLAGSRG